MIAGDGDLMEGISHEAIALAGHLKLNKLIVLFDDNGITIDGPLTLVGPVDQVKRFEAAGWAAERIDGHDPAAIAAALEAAKTVDRPIADRLQDHHRLRRADQGRHGKGPRLARSAPRRSRGARKKLGWTAPPFEIPPTMLERLARAPARAARRRARPGKQRLAALGRPSAPSSSAACAATLPAAKLAAAVAHVKRKLADAPKEIATRVGVRTRAGSAGARRSRR